MKNTFNDYAIQLSKTLPEEHRLDFVRFAMTGEAEPEFLKWLETDKTAQTAVEDIFDKSAKGLQNLGAYIRENGNKPLGRKP